MEETPRQETSTKLENFLNEKDITPQYVPPGTHRANKAERAIRTARNHLISTLSSAYASFPMDLWDEVVPQAEITLNHLHASTVDPSQSAYRCMFKIDYDFQAHPLAPFGTLVLVHDKPAHRRPWDLHVENKGSIWSLHCFITTAGARGLFAPRVNAFQTRSRGSLPNFDSQVRANWR